MNISQLRCFIVVAQNENLSKAASMLYISQSALSKSMTKLEEELGVPLFERHGKRITLNAQGRTFLESSIAILRELDYVTQDVRSSAGAQIQRFRIGCAGPSATLCDCLKAFCVSRPDVSFDVDTNIEDLNYVEMKNYDMVIYPTARQFEKLRGYPLVTERYYLVAPANHRLAMAAQVTRDDLMNEDFVFIRQGYKNIEHAYRLCGARAIQEHKRFFVSSHEMQRYLVGSGLALGFVTDSNRAFYEKDPDIRIIPVEEQGFERTLWICFRESADPFPLDDDFREFVISYFNIDTSKKTGGKSHVSE